MTDTISSKEKIALVKDKINRMIAEITILSKQKDMIIDAITKAEAKKIILGKRIQEMS